ncbi:MAG TPA: cyclic nucleotide-binding domain-containing protein [Thermoanaerobaculia bacterium]|jgi:CRP-like cAMP-binding protein|nr:cyclic nucleotide-binding domain-containing protein [Thermoanaerobaculia bacterium]
MDQLPPSPGHAFDLDEVTALAKRFIDGKLFDEAIQLYEMALRFDPKNMGIQLSLAQAKRLRRHPRAGGPRSLKETLREQMRRDALDAKHFLGLAYLFFDRADEERAREYLEIAIAKDLPNPAPHKLYGKTLLKRREFARAVLQLSQARRYNPFDRQVAQMLGRARYELGDLAGSLAAFIDGFLLVGDHEREDAARLKDRIQELKEELGWSNERLAYVFHQRQEELRVAFDRLEWHRERFREERAHAAAAAEPPSEVRGSGRIELAARLRHLDAWSHLRDEQIFQLTEAVAEEEHEKGQLIFAEGTPGSDLYVLEKGEITIQRATPYGTYPLGLLKPGDLFGEVNFLTRTERSGDAMASQTCHLLRLEAHKLDDIIRRDPELGVQIYWSFWHNLAFKLRCTNEQLRTFFNEGALPENLLRLKQGRTTSGGRATAVDPETKMRLFREQGLSNHELIALATFSRERTYPGGAVIFGEGDPGREMYVVLEGRVRISKFIPGGGEEALAILERGDFFGEMALIDGQPRSADARAHGGAVTVLALDEATIKEVLTVDPEASLEFLQLLCRLVAKRLREIDEKVIGWRIMSGQSEQASA